MKRVAFLPVALVLATGCADPTAPAPLSRVPLFSHATDATWLSFATMSEARFGHASAPGPDGRIYVFGGARSLVISGAEAYQPSANSWSPVASPGLRAMGGAALTGGLIYLVGGVDESFTPLTQVQAYSASGNSWSAVASLAVPRSGVGVAAAPDGRIYAVGGTNFDVFALTSGEVFTPGTGQWTAIAPMSLGRYAHGTAAGLDGKIYVTGGFGDAGPLAECEVYDPASNSWSALPPLPTPRFGHAAVAGADGHIYVIGGAAEDRTRLKTVLVYDPAARSWATGASLNTSRYWPGAVRGRDDKVYVTGGNQTIGSAGVTATSESYQTISLNRPPVAAAGEDQELECENGGAGARLDGSGSSDPDGDPLTYEWTLDGEVIATGASAAVRLELGVHRFTLRVTDDDGVHSMDEITITVADTRAPVISLNQLTSQIAGSNHQMEMVAVISVEDACDPAPSLAVNVSSSEPVNGTGDGDTEPDWEIVATEEGFQVWVRAERSGSGNGRTYSISASAADHAGNAARARATVSVPRGPGANKNNGRPRPN